MESTTIVIVSHLWAGRVMTLDVLPDGVPYVCVPESQEADYRAAHPDAKLLIHPDTVKGLPAKRQWIYEKIGNVFMLDDDVKMVTDRSAMVPRPDSSTYRPMNRSWFKSGRELGTEASKSYYFHRHLTPQEFADVIYRAHDTTVDLGLYLYGFLDDAGVLSYHEHDPFNFTSYIHGNGLGLVEGSGLWFNPEITMFEDVWIGALNASKHRICFRDERYSILISKTGTNQGGMASVRTQRSILADHDILYEAFGDQVIRERGGGATIGNVFDPNLVRFRSPFRRGVKVNE